MKCASCGEPVTMTGDNGVTSNGKTFEEYYECANKHTGVIEGVFGEPEERWTKTGVVFNGY